jgi:hypothetical protein
VVRAVELQVWCLPIAPTHRSFKFNLIPFHYFTIVEQFSYFLPNSLIMMQLHNIAVVGVSIFQVLLTNSP